METVARFSIQRLVRLDADGLPQGDLPAFAQEAAQVLPLYRLMTLCRLFDAKAVNLQRTGRLGTYAPCTGQEATHVGVGAAMRSEDVLFPVYREYGTQLWRGVTLAEILTFWNGDERGCDFAGPRQDFPWCVPIASQCPQAVGAAMAFRIRNQPRVAVAYIGDGGTSEGAFYEALNMAGAQSLPVVFVIVNNGWAISVPVREQTAAETLAQKGLAGGVPGVQVDGNDVIAVREVMEQALQRARSGQGPTVVEALTYRLSDHTTADDATRYRPAVEFEAAWQREPLLRLRQFITARGWWTEADEQSLRADCAAQIDAAVQAYQGLPKAPPEAMFDHLYAQLPEHLEEQRETARHYAAGHG